MNETPFDFDSCRRQFPALKRELSGQSAVYFDGPAGSQVPQRVADAVSNYLLHQNANSHGKFVTSRETDAMLESAHLAVADLLGTDDPDTVSFGANMTTLTLALSRALAREWDSQTEIIVTRLDHDANVTPWVLAARDAGATVHHIGIREEDCTLDLEALKSRLSGKTRLVAVGVASNATGSINPVQEIVEAAHAVGAEVFLDAVHYAPHGLIDVQAWGCDYLACSAYKFFGPHVGVLWGRRARMEALQAYKLRPAPDDLPGKWMTGTQSHEGIAGTAAAVEYLADLGWAVEPQNAGRRDSLVAAFRAITQYERKLIARLLEGLAALPSITVYGITDPERFEQRVPTVSFTHGKFAPDKLAELLGARGIFVWHGNYYALPLTETLALEPEGMVRVGLLHYNTAEEVDRLLAELQRLDRLA